MKSPRSSSSSSLPPESRTSGSNNGKNKTLDRRAAMKKSSSRRVSFMHSSFQQSFRRGGASFRRSLFPSHERDQNVDKERNSSSSRKRAGRLFLSLQELRIELMLLKSNPSVKDFLESWWIFTRLINMNPHETKQFIMTSSLFCHVLSRYSARGILLDRGMRRILALVVIPFVVPPTLVLGVPSLVFLVPLLLLGSCIHILNRRAKVILEWYKKPRLQRKNNLVTKMNNFINHGPEGLWGPKSSLKKSTRNTVMTSNNVANASTRNSLGVSSLGNLRAPGDSEGGIKVPQRRKSVGMPAGKKRQQNPVSCARTGASTKKAPTTPNKGFFSFPRLRSSSNKSTLAGPPMTRNSSITNTSIDLPSAASEVGNASLTPSMTGTSCDEEGSETTIEGGTTGDSTNTKWGARHRNSIKCNPIRVRGCRLDVGMLFVPDLVVGDSKRTRE
jgi:hypothetical protein